MEDKIKKALIEIPTLINYEGDISNLSSAVYENLKDLIPYDFAFISYLNSDELKIQNFKIAASKGVSLSSIILSDKAKTELLNSKIINVKAGTELAKVLKNEDFNFLIAPLNIRKTVFGFLIVASKDYQFTEEDETILTSFASICSYAIKDSELGEVFKAQFKVLQEDIVDREKAYRTIELQNKKILEADKVKNEFIANVSHELRTPLNAIIGFAECLGAKIFGPLTDKQAEYINNIHVSGLHLLGMINEILDISKIESNAMTLSKSVFDMNLALTEVVNIVKPLAAKKSINIDIKADNNVSICADYQKIQQVLYNLLSNAIKFTPEKGLIEVGATSKGKKVKFWVKDNGIGIDTKYHGKIFAKFVQLENIYCKKESSTGLGLTITKELVNMHNGKISLESKLNEGTKFTVEIPNEI